MNRNADNEVRIFYSQNRVPAAEHNTPNPTQPHPNAPNHASQARSRSRDAPNGSPHPTRRTKRVLDPLDWCVLLRLVRRSAKTNPIGASPRDRRGRTHRSPATGRHERAAYAQPVSHSRSSSMPKWCATSWKTVIMTSSATSSSFSHMRSVGPRKIQIRFGSA